MKVLKWPVPLDDQWHDVPGTPILVGEQGDPNTAQVWAVESDTIKWKARVFGTGHKIPDNAVHLGSYQSMARPLVWHVFALPA